MTKSILVVEDSRTQAERLRLLLEEQGYAVSVAGDGEDGLQRIRSAPPDLIISDVMMPRMDGYELCRQVKASSKTRSIPFVLLTDRRDALDIIRGLERGADNFITKPFEDEYLLERVRRIFENLELRRAGHLEMDVTLRAGGRKIVLSADKQQIVELLFSTFEELCRMNRELADSREKIERYARDLESTVERRTQELQSLFDHVPIGLYRTTPDGVILKANAALADMLGVDDVDDLVNLPTAIDFYADGSERSRFLEKLHREGVVRDYDVQFRRRDGRIIWARHNVRLLTGPDGNPLGYEGAVRDITESLRAEEALRSSEARKAAMLAASLDAIITIDAGGHIVEFNPAAERLFGLTREEATRGTIADLIVSDPAADGQPQVWRDHLVAGDPLLLDRRIEVAARRRGGDEFPAELALTRIATDGPPMFTAFVRDLSDRRRTEAELEQQRAALHQSEKLAAMGGLLAGVAHELNNPLAVVTGQALLLRNKMGGSPLAERADRIEKAAHRCARIVKNFLALARQQPPERSKVYLNQIVQEAVELLAYQLRVDDIVVDLQLAPDLPTISADPHQLHQVFVNLIVNAHHAMRSMPSPRRLSIRSTTDAGRERVTVVVSDTGQGMSAEVQARIFEPFFTTKPLGIGTGLGLPLCRGIVESHAGTITVTSVPGQGAAFAVELPLGQVSKAPVETAVTSDPVRARRILVVDDEPEIAATLADLLAIDGHEVTLAVNGREALEKLAVEPFDLIFSDIRMPDLDGPGLYEELERTRPEMLSRFAFVTGDTLGEAVRAFLEARTVPSITKPFEFDEVVGVVRRLVGAQNGP